MGFGNAIIDIDNLDLYYVMSLIIKVVDKKKYSSHKKDSSGKIINNDNVF